MGSIATCGQPLVIFATQQSTHQLPQGAWLIPDANSHSLHSFSRLPII